MGVLDTMIRIKNLDIPRYSNQISFCFITYTNSHLFHKRLFFLSPVFKIDSEEGSSLSISPLQFHHSGPWIPLNRVKVTILVGGLSMLWAAAQTHGMEGGGRPLVVCSSREFQSIRSMDFQI